MNFPTQRHRILGPEILVLLCRFLHGPETSRQKIMEIRSAIQEDRAVQVMACPAL